MPRQPQTVNIPSGIIPTSPAKPFGVKVRAGTAPKCVMDFTFGFNRPGATVRDFAALKKVAHFRDLFGADIFKEPRAPKGSRLDKMAGAYRHYSEFLDANGNPTDNPTGTRNPLCLHQVRAEYLELIVRQNMPGSSDTTPIESGIIRLPEHQRPGRYVEVRLMLPDPATPFAHASWMAAPWSYPGWQEYGGTKRWYSTRRVEIDGTDNYSDGGFSRLGESIVSGAPNFTGIAAQDIYLSNRPECETLWTTGSPQLIARQKTDDSTDPTRNWVVYGQYMHLDSETVSIFWNGVLARRFKTPFGFRLRESYHEETGSPTKYAGPNPDEFGWHHVYVSHQGPPTFNWAELSAVETRPEDARFELRSKVDYIRMYEVDIDQTPEGKTPDGPLPGIRTGAALGDLPAIATGTYVADVSALSGAVADRFGGHASAFGTAAVEAGPGGLPVVGYALKDGGGVRVRGPAVARAQGAHNFALFLALKHRNPYVAGRRVIAQFSRDWPASAAGEHKITLFCEGGKLGAEAADDAGNVLLLRGAWADRNQRSEVVVLRKDVDATGNATLSLRWEGGAGAGSAAVATAGAVPAANLAEFSELVLLTGRDPLGLPASGLNGQAFRGVLVSGPDGSALSAADEAAIVARLRAQWGV